MKPKLLNIKGVNSFVEKREIDFERLTHKGIFGIFGPTGSGKSSILDAITLALYGDIARDSKEFINTDCESAEISFSFEISKDTGRKEYRVDRVIKRKKSGGILTTLARVVEINKDALTKGEEQIVLAEGARPVGEQILKIIGLESPDFTRSVVLPQGKFSEFLKLTGTERRNMLERVLGLEKYGKRLMEKIRAEKKHYEEIKIDLQGQLKTYLLKETGQLISDEYVQQINTSLENVQKEEAQLKEILKDLEKYHTEYKRVWELQGELKGFKRLESHYQNEEEKIGENRIQWERGTGANIVLPHVQEVKGLKEKCEKSIQCLKLLQEKIPQTTEEMTNLQSQYNDCNIKQQEELPRLIQKIENCKQAEELQSQCKKVESETKQMQVQIQLIQKDIMQNEKETQTLESKKSELENQLQQIEARVKEIKVDIDERRKIEELYAKEKEYEKAQKEYSDINIENKRLDQSIKKGNDQYKELEEIRETVIAKVQTLEKKYKELEEIEAKMNEGESIEKRQIQLEKERQKQIQVEESLQQIAKLEKEQQKNLKKEEQIKSKIEQEDKEIILLQEKINELEIQIKTLEERHFASKLKANLQTGDSCPVCQNIITVDSLEEFSQEIQVQVEGNLENDKEKALIDLKEKQEKYKSQKSKLEIQYAQIGTQISILAQNIAEIMEKIKGIDIADLKNQIKKEEIQLEQEKKERQQKNEERKSILKELEQQRKKSTQSSNEVLKLHTKLEKDQDLLQKQEEHMDKLKNQLKEMEIEYQEKKTELEIENVSQKIEEIRQWEKETEEKQKQLQKGRLSLEKCNQQREMIKGKYNLLKIEEGRLLERQGERDQKIQDLKDNIHRLTQGKDPSKYHKELEGTKEKMQKEVEGYRIQLEQKTTELQEQNKQRSVEEKLQDDLKYQMQEKNVLLEKMLKEHNFESMEQAEKSRVSKEQLAYLKNKIQKHEDNVKRVNDNLQRIYNELAGRTIESEKWQEAQKQREEKAQQLTEKSKEIGEYQRELKKSKEKLKELKEIKKQEKEVLKQLDLLVELNKMVEGNRFVEYVATTQLKYIAREASKRLKEISRGRYALELDASGNFVMRDDVNGGVRRAINTLSGGETFLTSLSLALALSSQIQLKGSAPLEFFFLDEGFGTLDTELLEIVMNSLERLHSEKLSVGIISHVEELKNRLPIKLMVEPAKMGGEGTKVYIE